MNVFDGYEKFLHQENETLTKRDDKLFTIERDETEVKKEEHMSDNANSNVQTGFHMTAEDYKKIAEEITKLMKGDENDGLKPDDTINQ